MKREAATSPLGVDGNATLSEEEFTSTSDQLSEQKTDWSGLRSLFKPIQGKIVLAVLLAILSTVLQFSAAVAIAQIARQHAQHDHVPSDYLWRWLIIGAIGLVAGFLLQMNVTGYCHRLEATFRGDLRKRVTKQLNRVPLSWFDRHPSGEIKKMTRDDVAAIHTVLAHGPVDITVGLMLPIAGIAYLLFYDWRYALGLLLFFVVVGIIGSSLMGQNMKESTDNYLAAQARMSHSLVEMTEGITAVKNFGAGQASFKRFEKSLAYLTEWTQRWMFSSGRSQSFVMSMLTPAGMLLPIFSIGWALVHWAHLDPEILLPFLLVGVGLPSSLGNLISLFRFLGTGVEAAARLDAFLSIPPLPQAEHPTPIPDGPLGIEIEDVTFGYREENQVLHGITASFPAGTVTAIVGPSGSGKTTLTRLIARYADVQDGSIKVGGVDVRNATESDLLAHLAIVEQDVSITRDTVANNIALGHPDASPKEIEQAARGAIIHDRITRLPDGYQTVLGDGTAHLSGGEKQRLTLARVFLRKAPIVLLDEATAYADPHSEREIQQALSHLAVDRTVIVVAHRLSSVVGVDNILVLDHGRIVQQGTHEELLTQGGLYSQLWEAQQ